MSRHEARRSPVALEEIRRRAVKACRRGQSVTSVAQTLGVHWGSVSRWLTKWRRGGGAALRSSKASGRPPKLDCNRYGRRIARIVMRPAIRYGFESPLWTCRKIREVLRRELKLNVSTTTVWRGLRRMKLSCQKPERTAIEQDPAVRRKWLEEQWPAIKEQAKRERALLFFEDEAGVHLTPTVGRTWGREGRRPTVPATGKRGCISTMSAVTPEGRLFFMIPREKVNASIFISFLKALLRECPRRKVFVIADQASSHTAKATTDFVSTQPRLRLFYLPPYSPDYNPDEKVWDFLKNRKMAAHDACDKLALRKKTSRALRSMKGRPSLVRSFYKRTVISMTG